jgi:hypothetical protein
MMSQTSRPERTFILGNPDLYSGNEHFVVEAFTNLLGGSRLKKQLKGFLEVQSSLLNRISLASDIKFRTEGDIAFVFSFNNCK